MKIVGWLALFGLALAILVLVAGQLGLLGGSQPDDLGVNNGRLKAPSLTPNSVASQADLYPENPQRTYARIAPIAVTGDADAAMRRLADILIQSERTTLVSKQPDYLYAQSTSLLLKFTDDVEFWLDRSSGLIQVRSASRLGRGDLGVNRARIEKIRAQFQKN